MGEPTLLLFLRKFKFIRILSLFVFLSLVVIGTTTSFSHSLISNKSTTITIEKGQSLNTVLRQLSVTSGEEFLLKAYLFTSGIDFIQAGHYELVDKTWRQFFADISNGSIKQYKFKIQEGSNLFELEKLIQSSNLNFDCPKFSCLDPGLAFHEGTLMPDTYFYKHNSPVSTILLHSQAAFIDYSQSIWKLKTSLNPLKL